MADQQKQPDSETPQQFPSVTTPRPNQATHDFTLQAVMEMQKTLGGVCAQLDRIDSEIQRTADDVSKHGRWIFAANVVIVIAVGVFGWVLNMIWEIVKARFGI